MESGDFYGTIKPSIIISIVCGTLFPKTEKAHTVFRYKERELDFELTDKSELHYLELDKININKPLEEMTPLERFGAYIRYAADPEREGYIQSLLHCGEEVIAMTDEMLKSISQDDQMKECLRARSIFLINQRCLMWEATETGREEGKEEGRAEERAKSIELLILDNLEEKKTEEQILAKLIRRFSMETEVAKEHLAKYIKK